METSKEGVIVVDVASGSIAERLQVQKGDIVLAVNKAKIARTGDLEKATQGRRSVWEITISRAGQVFTSMIGG